MSNLPQEYMIYLGLIIGTVIGFLVAWFIKNKELELEKKAASDYQEKVDELVEDKFKSVATDILRLNSKDFLQLAQIDFVNKEKGFEKLVEIVNKSVESVEKKVGQIEKERNEQVGALSESVKQVLETGSKIYDVTTTLKTALSSSGTIVGRWGETVLKNLLEESDLTEGIDFFVQEVIRGDESANLKPDIIINLPGGLRLAVDSKANLEEFVMAVEEKQTERKPEHIEKFVRNLRSQIKNLSSKEYQNHLDKKIPYVVMFIPSEAAVRAAFEYDANLYREAQEKKVMLASPATIIPLILLIAHAWKQNKSVVNATKLSEEVIDLGNRLNVLFTHIGGIGINISQAKNKFNAAIGSWENKILPKIEQINTLGGSITIDEGAKNLKVIEGEPRESKKLLKLKGK